jgi:putative ABC transport system permease protein
MTETLWRLGRVDLGFEPDHVLTLLLQPTSGQTKSAPQPSVYFDDMTRRIAAVPGVERVGAAQHLPLSGFNWMADLEVEAHPLAATALRPRVVWRSVVADYFGAMRVRLLRGRLFEATDTRDAPPVVVVDSTLAARRWPAGIALGQRIRLGFGSRGQWATVVGVVADVRSQAPDQSAVEEVYRPNAQQGLAFMHFVIRTRGNPLAYAAPIRDAIRSADARVPIAQVRALDELFAAATSTRRAVALLLASFAALGFALGAVGIYGVVSHLVGQRTRELGIRAALGAAQRRVTIMVVGEGVRMASVGVAMGLVGSLIAARSLDALVFGVSTADPLVFGGVALLLLAAAAAASYLPARRAARADPLTALRSD